MKKPSNIFAMATLGSLSLAIVLSSSPSARAADQLAPLPLTLPAPTIKGTPPDDPPKGPNIEPLELDKKRPPFMAPVGVKNVAAGKKVAASDPKPLSGEPPLVTDGDKEANDESVLDLHKGTQHVTVDLESSHRIHAILLWLDHRYYHIFHDVVVQVADDAAFTKNVRTLFNNDVDNSSQLGAGKDKEYFETSEGKLVDARGATARYVRCTTRGSSTSGLNGFTEIEVWGLPAAP